MTAATCSPMWTKVARHALTALETLEHAGYESYLVGGCVRDLLRGKTPHDADITTAALPEQTKTVFADYTVIDTGIKHGTVTVLIDGVPLEITTTTLKCILLPIFPFAPQTRMMR